jgi:DNA processing protein
MSNKTYLLALHHMQGIGPRIVAKLLARWPCLEELFRLSRQELQSTGLPDAIIQAIQRVDMARVEADLRWEEGARCVLLTNEHPAYPRLLKEIYDPPIVLYAIGDLACLQQPTLGVVGSRNSLAFCL